MEIFLQNALDSLQKDIDENYVKYQLPNSWIKEYFKEKNISRYSFNANLDINDYQLVLGGPENDFQNARILFEAFKGKINPVQASDLRLWAYLAHVDHWDYMVSRWKINALDQDYDDVEKKDSDDRKRILYNKAIDRIKSRYFFDHIGSKAFVRQGIARLYWSAYLTYDATNEDPYEYTKTLFKTQDIFTSITERSYARNRVIILAILKELKKRPQLSRDGIRRFLAKLNQAGAITVLDFLNSAQANQLCEKLMDEVYKELKY